jgi:hypothetical protein
MTSGQRSGLLALTIAAAACILWVTWAWSPELEQPTEEPFQPAPEPPSPPVAQPAAPTAPAPAAVVLPPTPPVPAAQAPTPEAPAPGVPEPPARIPTPHPMSLDQTKPPEAYGSLAELKQRYETESRAADSAATEAKLREMVTTPNIPSELVQAISCHRSVCKIEAHWAPRRRIGYSIVLESFKNMYDKRVAVEPAEQRSEDGTYLTTIYIRPKP